MKKEKCDLCGYEIFVTNIKKHKEYCNGEGPKRLRKGRGQGWNKGKTLSKEHIEKLINYNTGRVVSKKTREKISKSKTGVPLSLEHKKKINHEGIKNPMYGKTHSNESKEKMRKRKEGFVPWNKGLNTKSLKKR